ncbi:MAG: hypothetical protein KDD32_02145 [Bacteroidetes bacterium]|nr:hypothetical protein [Bacteroidota bacterium]
MKNWLVILMAVIGLNVHSVNAQSSTPTPQPFSFNLNDLFNTDFDEIFQQLEEQMETTKDIWQQFIQPGVMDSTMQQFKSFNFGGSIDTIFNQLNLQFNDMGDISTIIDQFMQQFNQGGALSSPTPAPNQPPMILEDDIYHPAPKSEPKEEKKIKVDPTKVTEI